MKKIQIDSANYLRKVIFGLEGVIKENWMLLNKSLNTNRAAIQGNQSMRVSLQRGRGEIVSAKSHKCISSCLSLSLSFFYLHINSIMYIVSDFKFVEGSALKVLTKGIDSLVNLTKRENKSQF